jgi:hypothetical protein
LYGWVPHDESGAAEELAAVHALLSGGLGYLLGREVKGDREPAQRVRVRDATTLLDLMDRLAACATVASLLDGGLSHAPGDRGQGQA